MNASSRASLGAEQDVELANVLEVVELVTATDSATIDKDLRRRSAPLGSRHHFSQKTRFQTDIPLLELDPFGLKESFRHPAIAAEGAGIDLDSGHGLSNQKVRCRIPPPGGQCLPDSGLGL